MLSKNIGKNMHSTLIFQVLEPQKPRYNRLYRALQEHEKEFVAHSYCQLLLHEKWLGGGGFLWSSKSFLRKGLHALMLTLLFPFLCTLYVLSPFRDHKGYFKLSYQSSFLQKTIMQ